MKQPLSPHKIVLEPEQSTTLFRILQEILTNVARHAKATNVHIRLEQSGEHVSLQVRDNGRGITDVEQSGPKRVRSAGDAPARPTAGRMRSTFRERRELEQRSPSGSRCIGQLMINILLADDHPYLRRGLVQILIDEFPGAVIGEASECPRAA